MHEVYLALGSNLGNREENLQQAILRIGEKIGSVSAVSSFHTTEPIGFISENLFLNAVCKVESTLSHLQILEQTQMIEKEMGRRQKSQNKEYADRIIDIDLLMYGSEVINLPELVIPHPFMHQRTFVLFPMEEIASDVIHPLLNKTMGELKDELPEE